MKQKPPDPSRRLYQAITMNSRILLIALLLTTWVSSFAQTTVTPGSYAFSTGVHPSFNFIFEGTSPKYVESYWKDELKKISVGVSNKKEVTGEGSLIPSISPDTLRILMKGEQSKGSPLLTAYVSIQSTNGYIGPDSDSAVYASAVAFVQRHSTAIRRQLAQQELSASEKDLDRLRNDLELLEREKERAEASIIKSNEKAAEAAQEQITTRAEMDDLGPKVIAMRTEVNTTMNEDLAKELKGLEKDEAKAIAKNRRAIDQEHDMKKKAEDLALEITKNEEDQERKKVAIEQQKTLVKALKEKLDSIR